MSHETQKLQSLQAHLSIATTRGTSPSLTYYTNCTKKQSFPQIQNLQLHNSTNRDKLFHTAVNTDVAMWKNNKNLWSKNTPKNINN